MVVGVGERVDVAVGDGVRVEVAVGVRVKVEVGIGLAVAVAVGVGDDEQEGNRKEPMRVCQLPPLVS